MRRKQVKAFKKLGETVKSVLRQTSSPTARHLDDTEPIPEVPQEEVTAAIKRLLPDYDGRTDPDRLLSALIVYWKTNCRPPTFDEWSRCAGLTPNGRTSTCIKKLCISGKVIRIARGKWHGKYVPAK